MPAIFALIDCNNFYVSCERVFQPTLHGKPVVVLSNNDGCVIARSEEAKALGIPMGLPAFQLAQQFPAHTIEGSCRGSVRQIRIIPKHGMISPYTT